MAVVFLGLGSNLEPEKNLQLAARELCRRFRLQAISPVYRSAALGLEGDPFLNAVARVETDLGPAEINAEIEKIHAMAGRQRGASRFISRSLDIDLLLYDDLVDAALRVPRRDVLEFSFVLCPLAEIAPEYRHPVTGRTMREHWRDFDAAVHPLTEVDLNLGETADSR